MSTIPKHFGLKTREESYMFKEREKIRKETKQNFLLFKQKLAAKPPVGEDSDEDLDDEGEGEDEDEEGSTKDPGGKGRVPSALGSPRESRPASALRKPQAFQPQDFYRRSSAFLRHGPPKKPPAIAPQAGTSKPAVLLRPRARRPRSRGRSPGTSWSRRMMGRGPEREAPLLDVPRARHRQASSFSSLGSEVEDSGRLRRVRIRTHYMRDGLEAARSARPASRTPPPPPSMPLAGLPPPTRFIPTCIEEIIASLQSEAQLASDQTIKELIQSILGQNYDITIEDISLMEQMYLRPSQVQIGIPQMEAEEKFQIDEEASQTKDVYEEFPEDVSSIFQIEQEDTLEWEALEEESIAFKSQEISDSEPAEDSSKPKPSEDGHRGSDMKGLRRESLKVTSSEMLQIRGKEVKRIRKNKPVVKPPRTRKFLRSHQDEKLIKKIPQGSLIPHLHDLCTTTPAEELPIDLRLASRVFHTPDKKGYKTLLGLLGSSVLSDHFIDEQRERILYGVPVSREDQISVSVTPIPPEKSPESARRTKQHTHKTDLQLWGEEVTAYPGSTKVLWNVTAPKFALPESTMRETLYPKYESIQTSRILSEKVLSESKESVVILDTYRRRSFKSLVITKAASFENIQKHSGEPYTQLKRSYSAGELRKKETMPRFIVEDDTKSNMKQLLYQKAKELERQLASQRRGDDFSMKESLQSLQESDSLKYLSLSLIEASKKAGINYIVYPKKKKKMWKKGLKFQKLAFVYEHLSKPSKTLKRFCSGSILFIV